MLSASWAVETLMNMTNVARKFLETDGSVQLTQLAQNINIWLLIWICDCSCSINIFVFVLKEKIDQKSDQKVSELHHGDGCPKQHCVYQQPQ